MISCSTYMTLVIFLYLYNYKSYVVHFTYFCEKRGGGSVLRFSVLLRPGFFVFSVMTSISSVDTPVDRRRFVFSSVFVAY